MSKNFEAYRTPLRLITLGPFYYVAIILESFLEPYFSLRFPRSHEEFLSNPRKLFKALKANQEQSSREMGQFSEPFTLPPGSEFDSIESAAALTNEPDKNRTAGSYKLTYQLDKKKISLDLFVKFQCGRGLPLWLQAARAAVEPNIAREVMFYQRLAGQVEVRSPQPYYTDSIHRFNRVCLVLEHIEGFTLADWQGCPIAGIRGILQSIARMNAKFLGSTATDERTAWIPAHEGLDSASFIGDFIANEPSWYRELWAALVAYFKQQPVTLTHGDCRPGNMLFIDDGSLAKQMLRREDAVSHWPSSDSCPEVIFTDWEAVNVGPLLSDFNYCVTLGLTVGDRRAYQDRLLKEFLSTLQNHGVPAEQCDWEKCRDEVELLKIALYYGDVAVRRKGLWDKQGNTKQDDEAWSLRIDTALSDVNSRRIAARLNVAEESIDRLKASIKRTD
ncbi:MAG: aminoglycoside phosphotransferase family protein [Cyanobacteria bacterium J06631_12]